MILESILALSILGTTTHNGGLEIKVDQETKENVNKNLNEYDTPLFNKESETLNSEIQKKKDARQQTIKQSMFENHQRSTSQIADTKRTLFEEHKEPTTKAPYIQQDQEKNILPYFLMSVGALFTIGFAILTISKWRKREKHDAT
ncbi:MULTISPECIES: type VII secretion protein EssA [Staphylococcus]|uniref:type VII secretion protein EssA n=1 Tax=Staphylococcus TaxID=1279 RepID=UPI00208F5634|nr:MULTISPECIES: type VII secretion protein EssA [Staphylococcus]MCO4331809.1 type VII secretion protein EssA [Staphylococcus hyicus]MCO4335036.1 type VII secretion protein EssA [Staphylococcus hyicus]UWF56660.1 type VII secretion protein EssA [Staphylococcus hyicus]UXU59468.1 type VII secretion protein EssA [Staphylococcus agnetis]UXU61796.1 type VII secretion protein EssA [Staphylococcus agnetis]